MPIGPATSCPWLPRDAITNSLPVDAVRDALDRWSSEWFVDQHVHVLGLWAGKSTEQEARPNTMLVHDEGLSIVADDAILSILADLMYARPKAVATTPADDDRLKAAADRCFVDLQRRLAQVFRIAPEARWRVAIPGEEPGLPTHSCRIGIKGQASLARIVASDALLIRRLKAALPLLPKASPPAQLSEGLARQSIQLSARLGRCALPLSHLAELSPGDVLVLDRALDEPLDLAIDDIVLPARSCRIVQRDDHVELSLS